MLFRRLCRDWFCGLTWEGVYMYKRGFEVCFLLMTEFDCPDEVTLCGRHDVKIQLPTN